MNSKDDLYQNYVEILKSELVVALGCTEPIAIAYAGAKLREILGVMPEHITVYCSGNIVKNVKGVIVPNSGGQKGIQVAAVLGVLGGDATKELAVLETVTQQHIDECRRLIKDNFCDCELIKDVANLYIVIKGFKGEESAEVVIENYHVNVTRIVKNDKVIFAAEQASTQKKTGTGPDKHLLNVKDILDFAGVVEIDDIKAILDRQIKFNVAISEEGLKNSYGAEVGRTLLGEYDANNVAIRARARAAAGSDARMSGCALPVVINSGSGNQGITASLPVIEYAQTLKCSQEKLYRALVISNLVAIHQKRFIGSLSAYCGAVSAACGAGAGIAYLMDMNYENVCSVIIQTITNIGGMVCDGAKASCAAKIAVAVETAILAINLTKKKHKFHDGDGLVQEDVDKTIAGLGYVGRVGMKNTDEEIINLMLNKVSTHELMDC